MSDGDKNKSHTIEVMDNLLQQAVLYHQNRNYLEAKNLYQYILRMDASNLDALTFLGFLHAELGDVDDAISCMSKAVKINDRSEPLCFNLAVAYKSKGQLQNAERFFRRVLMTNPANLKCIQELAEIETRKNNHQAAADYYEKAMQLSSADPDIYNELALVRKRQKRYSEASLLFNKALAIKPSSASILANLGNLYFETGALSEAEKCFNAVIEANPQMVSAYIGLGNVAKSRNLYSEAIDFYEKSIVLDGKSIVALTNKAQTFLRLGRYQEALTLFNEASSLDFNFKYLAGLIIGVQLQLCDWNLLNKKIDDLQKRIAEGLPAAEPFLELTVTDSPRLQKKTAEIYCCYEFGISRTPLSHLLSKSSNKITVAYLSSDFRSHPVAFLTAELFELHSREKFKFIGISLSAVRDEWSERISRAFDEFIDASDLSDETVVKFASDRGIDIAIDLGGHTQNSRFSLFVKGLAPVQMSYLGYLGTSGSNCIDYIIADNEIIPTESQKFYSEKVAYLPSYQVNDSQRVASDLIFSRQALGIPAGAFVYCCFNNNYKILPEVFSSWMKILTNVDNSVLFLYVDSDTARENLRKESTLRGVDPGRLIFGERLSVPDYLARYRIVDLFLDTFPYNAGATASDALWMGVPVITRQGESFASRIASSLLQAIGLPELITKNTKDYETLACKLGQNTELLDSIKAKLAANRLTTRLFNTNQTAKTLEDLYEKAHQRAIAGLRPENIVIS